MKTLGKFTSDISLELFLSLLRANNIKYARKGNFGNFIGVNMGLMGEEEIFIDDKDFENGQKLLNEFKGESVE